MSPQSVALEELSLAQTGRKGDRKPGIAPAANGTKVLDRLRFFVSLEAACGKRDNSQAFAGILRPTRSEPAVAMTKEEERELRQQLARLQQEHRDLDAAIAALASSPGSDLIQVQRLKKRKLVLRDRIRTIEDQLTPDIIA
jgi:hypothetical protein